MAAMNRELSIVVLYLMICSRFWLSAANSEVCLVQQSPLGLACPGDEVVYRCTLPGTAVIWNFSGGEITLIPSSNEAIAGNFRAQPVGVVNGNFTSTLTFTAETSTVITCISGDRSMNESQTITVQEDSGPPSIPTLHCVDLSKDVSGFVNVTVSWTLSGGDSAYFNLINIVTNDPQPPYGGLLNITTASVTQRELTGFQAGYQYTITARGVNCGSQEGNESEPLTIILQVPDTPASCVSTAIYNQSSGMLLSIDSAWDTVPNQKLGIRCPRSNGNITQYQINFQTGDIENVNASNCNDGRCFHTFEPVLDIPRSYDSVSVVAENVVGVGIARTCTAQPISTTNDLVNGEIVDVSSPINATLSCTFLSEFIGSAHCRVQYGTDPTYTNLPYSAESNDTGIAGETVSVLLRERLNSSTVYYYTVSAVSGDVIVKVLAESFTTPEYNCFKMEIWNLPAPGSRYLDDVHFLDYGNCTNVQCVGLENTTLMTVTVAAYNNTSPGSTVHFFTDESNGYVPNTTTSPERRCASGLSWSGDPVVAVCILSSLSGWHIALIVIGVIALVIAIALTITGIAVSCCKEVVKWKWWRHYCIPISLIVISGLHLMIAIPLWIALGVVVSNPPNDSCVLPDVRGWLMFQLVFDIITLVIVMALKYAGFLILCYVCYYKLGHGFEGWLHVLYRMAIVLACVLYTIVAALWVIVGTTVAIPPSEIYTSSPLETWQIFLLVLGGILLVIVLLIAIFALTISQKYEEQHPESHVMKNMLVGWKRLYLSLMTVAAIFCAIGVALWTTVGVVVSSPPSSNVCDICWRGSRDGLVILGFVFSILALIYAMTAVIWVVCHVKYKELSSGKCATCCTVVTIVLLCLSVIGIPFVILVWCFKKTERGVTKGESGSPKDFKLRHFDESDEEEPYSTLPRAHAKPTSSDPPLPNQPY